jgi:transcriptional regulator with XRE-family HTH domain
MDHEMKLSGSAIRQSRIEQGWSQEQLAIASGLSLRTIQRVESEGLASLSTAASLAATFSVPLLQLQDMPAAPQPVQCGIRVYGTFYLGLAVLMLAAISESGRLPSDPQSASILAVNILLVSVGAAVAVPSGIRLLRSSQYVGVILALLGIPLVTLLCGGLVFSALIRHVPFGSLLGMGSCGIALAGMSVHAFRKGARQRPNNSPKPTPLRGTA